MNQKPTSSYKLALPEEILLQVEKPERYLGNELNVVRKDKSTIDIRFCMAFPDVYEIGMSHLGIQILYSMFNRRTDTWCERVYSPWIPGASGFILHGQTWITSCARKRFRSLRWNHRIP